MTHPYGKRTEPNHVSRTDLSFFSFDEVITPQIVISGQARQPQWVLDVPTPEEIKEVPRISKQAFCDMPAYQIKAPILLTYNRKPWLVVRNIE